MKTLFYAIILIPALIIADRYDLLIGLFKWLYVLVTSTDFNDYLGKFFSNVFQQK